VVFIKKCIFVIILCITISVIFATPYFGAQKYYFEQVMGETRNNINFDYKTIETEHFTIKYLPKAEIKARLVAFYAESNYEPVTSIFKMKPPRKTMIILKEYDQNRLDQLMTGYNCQGVIYIYDDPRDRCPLYVTIPHELSHAMLRYKYTGGYFIPNWLDEGIAVNVETSITDGNKANSDIVYPIDGLSAGLKNTPNAAYAQCSALVGYIIETYGEEALFQFLSQLTYDRKPLNEALMDTFHIDVAKLEQDSQQYFCDNKEIRGAFKVFP
jgi:hypothetical protein